MTFGESLKRFRSRYNLKQKDVAEKLKMKQPLYQRYESDDTVPAITFILKLADAYDVSTDYLLGRSDEPRPVKYDDKEVQEAFALRDMIGATVARQLAGKVTT